MLWHSGRMYVCVCVYRLYLHGLLNNWAYFIFYLVCDTRAYNLERHWNVNKFQCLSLRVYFGYITVVPAKWHKYTNAKTTHIYTHRFITISQYDIDTVRATANKPKWVSDWAHFHGKTHRFAEKINHFYRYSDSKRRRKKK